MEPGKRKNYFRKMKRTGEFKFFSASLTVEAAIVVSIVLISIASVLLMGFRLHDRLAAQNAVYRAIEEYSYRNPDCDTISGIQSEADSEDFYILSGHPTADLDTGFFTYSISGSVASGGGWTEISGRHVRTESLLWASTLADLRKTVNQEEEEEGGDKSGGDKSGGNESGGGEDGGKNKEE